MLGHAQPPSPMREVHATSKGGALKARCITSGSGRSLQQAQTKLWQHPHASSECWNKRLDKSCSGGHKFTGKGPTMALLSSSLWVDTNSATSHAQLHGGQRGLQGPCCGGSSGSGDESPSQLKEGPLEKALNPLFQMDQQGIIPSVDMYRSILKACIERKALGQVKAVLSHLARHRSEFTRCLGTDVVTCGTLEHAIHVLQRLPHRTVSSWTAMISGCIRAGQGQVALRLFRCMQEEGVQPDKYTFVTLLKACTITGDLEEGIWIHGEVLKCRCEFDSFLGTALVDMYARCGSIVTAQHVFETLTERDVASWTVILRAYVEQGQGEKALQLYVKMQAEGVSPNARTLVSILQACNSDAKKEEKLALSGQILKPEVLQKGKELHREARRRGFQRNMFVKNALVRMYMSCGSIADAEHVFDRLSPRNVVSWNTLLSGCTQQGRGEKALLLYQQMHQERMSPDARTFVSVLQAVCVLMEAEDFAFEGGQLKVEYMQKVKILHAEACRRGYWSDAFIGSSLMNLYANCGSILSAKSVFDRLSEQDVVVWTVILRAYVQQNQGHMALELYEQMEEDGVNPNARTFLVLLQACCSLSEYEDITLVDGQSLKPGSLKKGKVVHAEAVKRGYLDMCFGNTLLSMYAKCGSISDAQNIFDGLVEKDVTSWNLMVAGYAQQGHGDKALQLYMQVQEEVVDLDGRTFVAALHACGALAKTVKTPLINGHAVSLTSLYKGKVIHAEAVQRGYDGNIFVANALVDMYGKSGSTWDAQTVFDRMFQRELVTWNLMLVGCAHNRQVKRVLELYHQMQEELVSPDSRTFVTVLQACNNLGEGEDAVTVDGQLLGVKALQRGKAIHAEAFSRGHGSDLFIGNALVSMYGKCGSIKDAHHVFFGLSQPSIVSWNSMLAAYSHGVEGEKAIELYAQLHGEGVSPNYRTFVSALQSCASLADKEDAVLIDGQSIRVESYQKVKAIHAEAQRRRCEANMFVCSILIWLYGRCGSLVDAQIVFDGFPTPDVVLWNVMLATYTHQGQADSALNLFRQMQEEGIGPDDVTFFCILKACSSAGALDVCMQIHNGLVAGKNAISPLVAHTLIFVYGRCASMVDAQKVFDALVQPDVVSWTALIAGYARQGNCETTLQCFEQMSAAGVQPNGVTYLTILSACCHAGMVTEGVEYFESMSRHHGITPEIQHYVTLVDLLGRVGYFQMVEELLLNMPIEPDLSMWLCLMGACQKHGNVRLAKRAFHHAVCLQPTCAAAYILLSNIFTRAGMCDHARQVDALRRSAGARKEPGESWIQHEREAHTFLAGDKRQQQRDQIHQLLERLVN